MEDKNLKLEDLMEGMEILISIDNEENFYEAVVHIEGDKYYALSNRECLSGCIADDLLGYEYSWAINSYSYCEDKICPTYTVRLKEKDWTKATKEELIEEAKKRYPIGTMFKTAASDSSGAYTVKGNDFDEWKVYGRGGVSIYEKDTLGLIFTPDSQWAEIISKPEDQPLSVKGGEEIAEQADHTLVIQKGKLEATPAKLKSLANLAERVKHHERKMEEFKSQLKEMEEELNIEVIIK